MPEYAKGAPDRFRESTDHSLSSDTHDLATRMQVLVEAYDYAHDLGCDVWDFAVEIAELVVAGLTHSDLRWLIRRGLVEHGGETTFTGELRRSFRRIEGLKFCLQSCFVLSESGCAFARKNATSVSRTVSLSSRLVERLAQQTERIPQWDCERHELLLSEMVVKQFKLPAPNQEAILMAFEEEEWAPKIDDPIPPVADQDPKQRLRDTIKSLNRNQKNRLIRFTGDGSGEGVLWELIDLSNVENEDGDHHAGL